MRVLGIDCGTERTGFGIIDSDGRTHTMVKSGCIRTSPKAPLSERLLQITRELRLVIAEFGPDCGAVEDVFHAINAKSSLKLAHVRGVALLVLAEASIPVGEYSPLAVEMSFVGFGRAEKTQVQRIV